MPNTTQSTKQLISETIFWGIKESNVETPLDVENPTEMPNRVLLELPRNWWLSHSSIPSENKLKKVDLIRINNEKADKRNLPMCENWDVAQGDYIHALTYNEEEQVSYQQNRKNLEKKIFGAVLIFVALIILLVSFIASMI